MNKLKKISAITSVVALCGLFSLSIFCYDQKKIEEADAADLVVGTFNYSDELLYVGNYVEESGGTYTRVPSNNTYQLGTYLTYTLNAELIRVYYGGNITYRISFGINSVTNYVEGNFFSGGYAYTLQQTYNNTYYFSTSYFDSSVFDFDMKLTAIYSYGNDYQYRNLFMSFALYDTYGTMITDGLSVVIPVTNAMYSSFTNFYHELAMNLLSFNNDSELAPIDTNYIDLVSFAFTGIADDYDSGFNDGFQSGYGGGFSDGESVGYNNGFEAGYNDALSTLPQQLQESYNQGYAAGYVVGSTSDSTITQIFSGILQVGLIPVNFFLAIFNFEILGINISGFISAMMTVAITVIIVRLVIGGKSDG